MGPLAIHRMVMHYTALYSKTANMERTKAVHQSPFRISKPYKGTEARASGIFQIIGSATFCFYRWMRPFDNRIVARILVV